MRDPEPADQPRRPSLARAIRESFSRYLDDIVLFAIVNVGWALAFGAFAFVRIGLPVVVILTPLLALPTACLMRLAVATARDSMPTWPMAREEFGRLAGRKVALAAVQLLILGLSLTNVVLGGSIGGVAGMASAVVAGYALIAVSVYALALWPIVCDPAREAPVRDQLRLALALVTLRPLQLVVLAVITVLAIIVSIQLIVPLLFLPSLVLIAIAGYVVPVADRLRPA
ncbi:MAG TPA: hypothetical protein VFN76_11910 [Candidatus Limnocylindria bacterium]|nr:hypothetical protein [Candidatus Limnocylindria bacterium]